MACDICGKVGTTLISIREQYRTDEIVDICPDCEKTVSTQLDKIQYLTQNMEQNWVKEFMRNLSLKIFERI